MFDLLLYSTTLIWDVLRVRNQYSKMTNLKVGNLVMASMDEQGN